MNKYRVRFTEEAKQKLNKSIEMIYGYDEEDALLRAGINKKDILSISQVYI